MDGNGKLKEDVISDSQELMLKRSIALSQRSLASPLFTHPIRYKASHSSKLHCKTAFLPVRKHESPIQRPPYNAVKVKVTPQQAIKAHRSTCIIYSFIFGAIWGWVLKATPRPPYPSGQSLYRLWFPALRCSFVDR
jgi:hypothetical protein